MNELLTTVDWSRAQFALTAIYHWLFVPLTLGLGLIVAIMETIYYRTRSAAWLATVKFWMTLFGVNFAIGVATGLILEFEFGTNWANYSWFVGDIFGAPLAIEGILAFFMESTFVAVMFFGWNRVSARAHLAATWLTAMGAALSALWILVANAWMQDPVGCTFNPLTMRNEMTSFAQVALSPTAVNKFLHTVLSAWVLGGAFVLAVTGWMLLRGRNTEHCLRSARVGAAVGLVGIVLTAVSGDTSAVNVAARQPMKLAAMEGLYKGGHSQELVAFGILNPKKTVTNGEAPFLMKVSLPCGLSLLANHDAQSFVPGIGDLIAGVALTATGDTIDTVSYAERMERGRNAREAVSQYDATMKRGDAMALAELDRTLADDFAYFGYAYLDSPSEAVPNVPLTFYSFHLMVTIGGYLVLFMLVALLLAFRWPRALGGGSRWARAWHWLAIATLPLTYLCSCSGWVVAEVGRQPWVVQDLMPAKAAISGLSAGYVQATFWVFVVVFTTLLIADVSIMCRQISKKSKTDLNQATL